VKYTALDRLMIETDAPFMLPKNFPKHQLTKYQERRKEPKFLPFVAATVAEFKEISVEKVAGQTMSNAKFFFKLNA
jgi:TatD DNase family protein